MDAKWVRLSLDVERFDAGAFMDDVERCRRGGIELTTIAELGASEPNHRRLYELNRICWGCVSRPIVAATATTSTR